jgi:Ca2+-binding EF-hand superfamily protein
MINGISSISSYATSMIGRSTTRPEDDLYEKIDSDSSGGISKDEFSAFLQKMSEDSGTTYDVDELFTAYDADGDGILNEEELDTFMKENAPPPPPNATAGVVGQMSAEDKQQLLQSLFQKLDTSGDGGIDATEFSAFTDKISEDTGVSVDADAFSTYDTDGDSQLSEEELDQFLKDNPPPPPSGMRSDVLAAYAGTTSTEKLNELIQSIESQLYTDTSNSTEETDTQNSSLLELLNSLKALAEKTGTSSSASTILNVTA